MQFLVDLCIDTKRHADPVKCFKIIARAHQTAFGFSFPVSPRRHNAKITVRIGNICVDTGNVTVALAVIKRIFTGFIKIPKCKSAEVSNDIHKLYLSINRRIYIQMNGLLDSGTRIMIARMLTEQRIRHKNAGSRIKPYLIRIKRIDLNITQPVQQTMVSVILRFHVGSIKI